MMHSLTAQVPLNEVGSATVLESGLAVITAPLMAASRDFKPAVQVSCLLHSIDAWVTFAVKPVFKVSSDANPLGFPDPSIEDKLSNLSCTNGVVVHGAAVPVGIDPVTNLALEAA